MSPLPAYEAKEEEAEAEEAEGEHLEEEEEEGYQETAGDQEVEEGYQEPAGDQEAADEEADAEEAEEEADWAGLYEDPADYDAQRWTSLPLDLFMEQNIGEKFQKPPKVLPIYQRGVATLPERPHSPFVVLKPKSVRYVFFSQVFCNFLYILS
jgi:hypothetical protein